MKQGTALTRVVIIVLLVAVLAYIGIYIWQGLSEPFEKIVSYTYEVDDGAALEGVVVRAEEVVDGRSALSEILPGEGEKVSAGAAVALVYQNESALNARRRIKELELQLDQLNYAMRRGDVVGDGGKLDQELVERLGHIRAGVSAGELADLEEDGLALRSLIIKRTGDASTTAQSLSALRSAAAQVEGELSSLRTSSQQQSRAITVPRSGVFSGVADGYESLLTPETLDDLTVEGLNQLKTQQISAPDNAVGKLITNSRWYFAAIMDEESVQRVKEGSRCAIAFHGDLDREITMRLDRIGPKENGRRLVVFSTDQYLNQVTLARFTSATLVFQRFTGVRVPTRALRVRDNEDGSTTLGVFTLVGRRAEFKPVEIVREGEDFYLLKGAAEVNKRLLRPGDVILISNRELYDGKVVEG